MAEGDFKKVGARGYKAWRILSASDTWASIYRQREKTLRDYRSAIIFPEQLLGLDQENIFSVVVTKQSSVRFFAVTSTINVIRNFKPVAISDEPLVSLGAIMEYESNNSGPGQSHRICLGTSSQDNSFFEKSLFSGIKDAVKYQQDIQKSFLSSIG